MIDESVYHFMAIASFVALSCGALRRWVTFLERRESQSLEILEQRDQLPGKAKAILLVFRKGEQVFVFSGSTDDVPALIQGVYQHAADPQIDFNKMDASLVIQQIRKLQEIADGS